MYACMYVCMYVCICRYWGSTHARYSVLRFVLRQLRPALPWNQSQHNMDRHLHLLGRRRVSTVCMYVCMDESSARKVFMKVFTMYCACNYMTIYRYCKYGIQVRMCMYVCNYVCMCTCRLAGQVGWLASIAPDSIKSRIQASEQRIGIAETAQVRSSRTVSVCMYACIVYVFMNLSILV